MLNNMSQSNELVEKARKQINQESPGRDSLSMHSYIKITLIGVLLWFFFRNELSRIVYRWVTDSSWSHGFLIPLFSLYFLSQNKEYILQLKPKQNYFGLFLLICCLIFYPLNVIQFKIAYLLPLAMIATIGSIVLFMGSWKLVKYTWLPVLYLVFAVPLPVRLYKAITIPMRALAATIASGLLSAVPDLDATANGVVIDVIYKGIKMEPALDVAEACSGMRLLMAFLALGVAMAYLHYRPAWQRIVLLCSTIPIAVICNVIRVTTTGFIYVLWDPKYAQGIYHDMLGMLMLPLAFGIYGFLAWMMSNLLVEDSDQTPDEIIIKRRDSKTENDSADR